MRIFLITIIVYANKIETEKCAKEINKRRNCNIKINWQTSPKTLLTAFL